MARISYCSSRNVFIYKDPLGFTVTQSASCECKDCLFKNRLFCVMIQHLWDSYHSMDQECYSFVNASGLRVPLITWLDTIKDRVSCWWQHYVKPSMCEAIQAVTNWLPTIVQVMYVLSLFYRGYKFINPDVPEADSFNGPNYYKFDQPKIGKHTKINFNKHFTTQAMEQRNVVKRKFEDNAVIITASYIHPELGRQAISCHCLVIRSRTMIALRHYIEEFRAILQYNPHFMLHFSKGGRKAVQYLTFQQIFGNLVDCKNDIGENSSNFCIVELPKAIPLFKNILPFIASQAQHRNIGSRIDIYQIGEEAYLDMKLSIQDTVTVASSEVHITPVVMDRAYNYPIQRKGMCGSVVVSYNINNGNGAIIGMHVAGSERRGGMAEPLVREMFEEYFGVFKEKISPEILLPELKPVGDVSKLDSNLLFYGLVEEPYVHHESGKSKITKSLLYDQVYEHVTEINPLRPNDPRQPPGSNPLFDGCQKHGTGTNIGPFRDDILDVIDEDISMQFEQIHPLRPKVEPLTYQDAICGNHELPHYEPINWKSSEGYPLSSTRPPGVHDKRYLFDLEETENGYKLLGLHPKLQRLLEVRKEMRKRGIVPVDVYVDCLKDYRLPIKKCKIKGKTRIFSMSPIQLTIEYRVAMQDFLAAYVKHRLKTEHAIGINPDSLEWTDLANYLLEVGDNIIAGDYSNYGPCLSSVLVERALKQRIKWLERNGASEDHIKEVEMLHESIINPIHLCQDVVYQTLNGIASGSAETGPLNSDVNKYLIRYAYMILALNEDVMLANMTSFRENVRVVVYGDDITLSVSDKIKSWFNGITIQSCFEGLGITFTSASKDNEMVPYGPLTDATFLKRGFAKHPFRHGVWLAPVAIDSVQEVVNWIHVGEKGKEDATLEVCEASMDLAYGHGPDYYQAHRDRIVKGLQNIGLDFKCKTWLERDQEVFGHLQSKVDIEMVPWRVKMPWYTRDEADEVTYSSNIG